MSLAVAEEIIDDHADDGEQEDNEGPDDLVGDGAVRLEDLDCGTGKSAGGPTKRQQPPLPIQMKQI